jgi:hypothetical protein
MTVVLSACAAAAGFLILIGSYTFGLPLDDANGRRMRWFVILLTALATTMVVVMLGDVTGHQWSRQRRVRLLLLALGAAAVMTFLFTLDDSG